MRAIKKIAVSVVAALVSFTVFSGSPVTAGGIGSMKVEWQLRDDVFGAHPAAIRQLDDGNLLLTFSGYTNSQVLEIDREGNKQWVYENIRANSAQKLPNGNYLLADSGAPAYPFVPRVVEVDSEGEIVWQFDLPSRSQQPTFVDYREDDSIIVATRNSFMVVEKSGHIRKKFTADSLSWTASPVNIKDAREAYLEEDGIDLTPKPAVPLEEKETQAEQPGVPGFEPAPEAEEDQDIVIPAPEVKKSLGDFFSKESFIRIVDVKELPNGDYLVVDEGMRGRGRGQVLQVAPGGDVVRRITGLSRPSEAIINEDGNLLILEAGNYELLEIDDNNELVNISSYRNIISGSGVANQWRTSLTEEGDFIIALSYSSGATGLLEIKGIPPAKIKLAGETFLKEGQFNFFEDNSLMIPLSKIMEALEGQFSIDQEAGIYKAKYNDVEIQIEEGSQFITLDTRMFFQPKKPTVIDEDILVLPDILKEAFGVEVTWDNDKRQGELILP